MSWSFLPARSAFATYAGAWDQLNRRLFDDHPLLATSFVGPLIDHFADGRDLLAVHEHAGAADAMLLLRPGRFRWSSFMPSQTQVAPCLVSDAAAIACLLRALPPAVVALDLPCQDPLCSRLADAPASAIHERAEAATTLTIDLSTDFDTYWSQRSRKLRQNLRRALRSIEASGADCRLQFFRGETELGAALQRYARIESSGWKGDAGTAIDLQAPQGRFYADMLGRCTGRGQAEIVELHIDGRIAASQMLLLNDNMMITLKTTHDESLAAHSPGNVLDYLLLEREFAERRVRAVEYYTNASSELLRWGTAHRTITHHRWYRSAWVRRLIDVLRRRPRGAVPTIQERAEQETA